MTETLSKTEYRKQASQPKRSKYGAVATVVDGIRFQSKREAAYYGELKMRERAGEVDDVKLQEPFVLAINGCVVCTYKADFVFYDLREKRRRVVDTKGFATSEFRLKAKLMRAVHGIEIEVVR